MTKKKKKQPTAPVEVHLSEKAEETLDKEHTTEHREAPDEVPDKADANNGHELESNDYTAIFKKRKKLGHQWIKVV